MELFQTYSKEIVALLVPFITWLLNAPQRDRVKLIHGTRHAFTFIVQQPLLNQQGQVVSPTQNVLTASVMIQNAGKKTAKNVEMVFNWKPMCINMWPSRHIEEKTEPDGRYCITMTSLAPGEFVGFELLAVNANLPNLITARSDEAVATEVLMAPQQVHPAWKRRTGVVLIFAGMAAVSYLILTALQLVLWTPS